MYRLQLFISLCLSVLALSTSAEINVTAIFNPPRIAMGDKSQYIVEIKETDTRQKPEVERVTSLPIPQSGGLELSNGRTSTGQQTSILNGAAEYSVTQQLIIDAKPPRVGNFTIPSYVFQYKGETHRVPAATLQTVERSADAGPTADELIFLKSDTPDQLYVGQTTPIQLQLYISDSVQLTGLNSFDRSADGFTISELPDSRQSQEIYNGRQYIVYTWPLTMTPIQTGEQDLDFQFTVSANVPDQNNRRGPFGGRANSLFDNFFGRSERFTVYTEPTSVEVLSLPTSDQPRSFTGAIGDFSIQVYTDRQSTQVGEPIMLSVEIAGTGNFERINGPAIAESPAWRAYDPESNFLPHAENNVLRGTKRFDYVMIPNQAGRIEIPEVHFAYFNAATKRYSELSSPAIPIKVTPSDKPAPVPVAAQIPTNTSTNTVTALPLQKELSMEDALLTLDYRHSTSKRLDQTGFKSPAFWIINASLALALTALSLWLRHRRRLKEDAHYADQQAAKQALRSTTTSAQQAKDADSFYTHAQNAVRLAVTYRTKRNYRTANIDELTTALERENIDETISSQTRKLFESADAYRFASNSTRGDLSAAKAQLERILKAI